MARTTSASAQRPSRTPVNGRNILTVKGKDENYVYRFVNDAGDRIAVFQEAGYELVDASTVRIGDKRVNQTSAEGSKAQVSVGKGDKAYLMRIPKDWHAEDQLLKKQATDQLEQSIKQTASSVGDYGKLTINTGQP